MDGTLIGVGVTVSRGDRRGVEAPVRPDRNCVEDFVEVYVSSAAGDGVRFVRCGETRGR